MYGTQAIAPYNPRLCAFENDVKMYGTQAAAACVAVVPGLRMM